MTSATEQRVGTTAGRIRLAVPAQRRARARVVPRRHGRDGPRPADHQGRHRRRHRRPHPVTGRLDRPAGRRRRRRLRRSPTSAASTADVSPSTSSTTCGPRCTRTITRLDGRRQDELSTGQVVGRATSDLQLIQGLLFMLPMTIGNVLLFLISLVHHGVAVAAAHPGRARRRPRPLVHRQAQPHPAPPRHLVRPEPGRRRRGRRRRGRLRRPGRQGLRPGGPGDREAAGRSAAGCSPAGCAPSG